MTEQQEFCLRWNDFHSNFHLSLEALRGDESFTDVTLSCSGRLMKAHRVILSACSVHFKEILRGIPPQQHPVIVLPTVDYDVMQAILEFIYQGQVNVRQSQLGAFLQVAETFSIQGLADDETKKNAGKNSGRSRPGDTETPVPKRRRADQTLARPSSPPTTTPSAPTSSVSTGEPSEVRRGLVRSGGDQSSDADKTVNISVSIKAEGMADTMVGELLEHSQPGQMLDPDMEGAGSDVVAQAMATMSHESGDASANMSDALRSLDSLVTALASPPRPAAAVRPVRSAVRDFFSGDGQDRVCRLCGVGVRLNRQLSTSGLWSHMRHRHGETIRAIGALPPPAFWPAAAAAASAAAEGAAPAPSWPPSPQGGRQAPVAVPPTSDCKAWFTQSQAPATPVTPATPERSPFRTEGSADGLPPDSV